MQYNYPKHRALQRVLTWHCQQWDPPWDLQALVVFTPFPINKPAWKCTRLQLLEQIAQQGPKIGDFINGCGQAERAGTGAAAARALPSLWGSWHCSAGHEHRMQHAEFGTECQMSSISILGSLLTQSKALNSHSPSLAESNEGPCQALDNFLEKECC